MLFCIDTEEVARWVECLPGMHKVVGSLPSIALLGVVADTCNLNPREMETGGSEVRSHLPPVGIHETSEMEVGKGRGEREGRKEERVLRHPLTSKVEWESLYSSWGIDILVLHSFPEQIDC